MCVNEVYSLAVAYTQKMNCTHVIRYTLYEYSRSDEDFEQGVYYKPKVIKHRTEIQQKKDVRKKKQSTSTSGGKQLPSALPVHSLTMETHVKTQYESSVRAQSILSLV